MINMRFYRIIYLVLICLLGSIGSIIAQDTVTADDVNEIASKLYCPVCENIPLDTCGTAACEDWRNEIRIALEQGKNEEEIIDDFVFRFGDRVVGTPKDPILRNLSLLTPWIVVVLMLVGMAMMMRTWQRNRIAVTSSLADSPVKEATTDDEYLSLLERDVLE